VPVGFARPSLGRQTEIHFQALSGPASAAPPVGDDSAFDVFGVTPQTPTSEIAAIFQRMMQAENAPERRLIAAFKTIKALRAGDGNPAVPG